MQNSIVTLDNGLPDTAGDISLLPNPARHSNTENNHRKTPTMRAAPSKYAENQFLVATVGSYALMSEVLADTLARATAVVGSNPAFAAVLANLNAAATAWNTGETLIANATAALPAATFAFEDKMAALTRKPDADTPSLIESWDTTIRGQVAYQGPVYMTLLPRGRETLTAGSWEERLDALRDFGLRLTGQVTKPVLIALGSTVTTFATAARTLRTTQISAKGTLAVVRAAQEPRRITAANALYALVGQAIVAFSGNPSQVDTVWNVDILRSPPQSVPAAPADTTWTPATRSLATTALPSGATRLEAWRLGPGGTPELLLTGPLGANSLTIPASITWTPGDLYQLWLVALNSRGPGAPGPVQNWTAV